MVMCFVPDCKHYCQRDKCQFFRFPVDEKTRSVWIRNIRRADTEPKKHSRICSCHFKDGLKSNGPTIFARNEKKIMNFESPEKRERRKKCPVERSRSPVDRSRTAVDGSQNVENSLVADNNAASTSKENATSVYQEARILMLEKEVEVLKAEVIKVKKQAFSLKLIDKEDEKIIPYYTGLPSLAMFNIVLKVCTKQEINYYCGWKVESLSLDDQLFLTLMKLKLNLGHEDLSFRFKVSTGTVSNVFLTWIHILHETIFMELMKLVPSQAKNQMCLPACFTDFQNCRMVFDCTEFRTEIPKRMDLQKLFYSSYKHFSTIKILVGVAPNGVITYAGEGYPGSTSDKEVVKHSNVVHIFQPGDLILADKGFLITDIVPDGVSVNIPPFLFSPQFTPNEVLETRNIARARIHVERAIRRVKLYKITRLIPVLYFKFSTKIMQVCAALTNFDFPLIKEVEHLYNASSEFPENLEQ